MEALDALGEPVRRRILELVGSGELAAGEIAAVLAEERGLSQPATSQHLKVLREAGLLQVRVAGTSRLHRLDRDRLAAASAWFDGLLGAWEQPLDALGTELARGRRERRREAADVPVESRPATGRAG